jgi:Ni,Fe-hydrogenase III small subunit
VERQPTAQAAAADEVARRIKEVLGRSLALRHLDAGSCNGCDWELTTLLNPVYDVRRLGIDFVASPRHADGVIVTGPVTRNLEQAVRKTLEAVPEPRIVVAVGACACSGGIAGQSYASAGGGGRGAAGGRVSSPAPAAPEAIIFESCWRWGAPRRRRGRPGPPIARLLRVRRRPLQRRGRSRSRGGVSPGEKAINRDPVSPHCWSAPSRQTKSMTARSLYRWRANELPSRERRFRAIITRLLASTAARSHARQVRAERPRCGRAVAHLPPFSTAANSAPVHLARQHREDAVAVVHEGRRLERPSTA